MITKEDWLIWYRENVKEGTELAMAWSFKITRKNQTQNINDTILKFTNDMINKTRKNEKR